MRLNKELAKKILGNVSEESRFFAGDGKVFSNLEELKIGLRTMEDETFFHHTGEGRNDFSNWISECLGDARLADSLIGLDKDAALKKIRTRIRHVERYLEKNS